MKTIILDLNGVVLEKADGLVLKKAIRSFGAPRTALIFLAYKLGKMSPEQAALIMPIIAEAENEVGFLPMAPLAVELLAGVRDAKLKVCSNFASKTQADGKLSSYVNEGCGGIFGGPGDITLIPINEGKKDCFAREKASGADRVIVVDDSMRNIRAASEAGCSAVLISRDLSKRAEARRKYGAQSFGSLIEFASEYAKQ